MNMESMEIMEAERGRCGGVGLAIGLLFAGLAAGLAVGFLYAPRSGKATREMIRGKAVRAAKTARGKFEETTQKIRGRAEEAKEKAEEIAERTRGTRITRKEPGV